MSTITILHQSNNRVYKRQNAIRDSQEKEKEKVEEEEEEEKCQDPQTEDDEIPPRHIVIPSVITRIDFWKRTKIYPEEAPVYPDASTYVSSRKRTGDGRRARTNEYASDDSDSDSDSDNIIT
jgi:hypothetical protein